MNQAIVTKYYGPTDTKPSRIVAKCDAGSVSVFWNYAENITGNHRAAIDALIVKLGWINEGWIMGSLPNGAGYCAVKQGW